MGLLFGTTGRLAGSWMGRTGTSVTKRRGKITSTSTSTSRDSSTAFPTRFLKSMGDSSTLIGSFFGSDGGGRRAGGSTMRYTPAGAAVKYISDKTRVGGGIGGIAGATIASKEAVASLLIPGSADIAATAGDSSGVAGLLAGGDGGSVVDAVRRDMAASLAPGAGSIGDLIGERTGGRLRLVLEESMRDPRERRATERGEPPIAEEETETYSGPESMTLRTDEKPAVLAVIEENIRENGTPERITLIIKKLISTRFRAVKYTLFKKSVFTDRSYDEGREVSGHSVSITGRYTSAVLEAGFRLPDVIIWSDTEIEAGRIYAYKIRVRYDADVERGAEDREEMEAVVGAIFSEGDSAILGDGARAVSFLDGVRGEMTAEVFASLGLGSEGRSGGSGGGSTGVGGSGGTGDIGVDVGIGGGRGFGI